EPAGPTNLRATVASSTEIDLSWDDNSGNETGFVVERGTTGANIVALSPPTARNVKTWKNTGLTASTTYFFRVRGFNGAGNSFYSKIISARTASPTAPSGLTVTITGTKSVDLAWVDNANNESSYIIEHSTDGTTLSSAGTAA